MKIKANIIKHRLWFTALLIYCSFSTISSICTAKTVSNPVKCRVELDRNVLPAKNPQNVVVKVTLDAEKPKIKTDRPKVNLSIVLDRSGSMSGQKIEKAKEAAIEAMRRLGPRDICSVVIYDQNVQTIVPAQSAGNIEWIESRIHNIHPGGNTALFGGVSQGASEIRKNLYGGYVHRIILLSDGIANVGPSSPEELGRLGAALLKEDIAVTTIGVGTDYNEDLMANLSQNSDGNTYFVESSRDLPRIFTAELGDVLDVVAKRVKVIIECPGDVTPVRIIGRDGRIRGQTIELSLNQLYGGQEKYALVEVTVPEGRDGQDMDIAMAEVSYINAYTQEKGLSRSNAKATFSRDMKIVKQSANIPVQKELYLMNNAIAQEKAITLSDEGKQADAALLLKSSAQKMREFGNENIIPEMVEKAAAMEQEADAIETKGLSNKKRKWFRAESYQTMNNQSYSPAKSIEMELKTDTGNTPDKVYSLAEVDSPPGVIQANPPKYPFEVMQKGIEGKVLLAFVVTKEGKVRDARVVSAEPEKIFDQVAIDSVLQYTFTPATKDGKPVDFRVKMPITFNVKESDNKNITKEELKKLRESLKVNERLLIDKNGKIIIEQHGY